MKKSNKETAEIKAFPNCPCWTCPSYDGWQSKEVPECQEKCDSYKEWIEETDRICRTKPI